MKKIVILAALLALISSCSVDQNDFYFHDSRALEQSRKAVRRGDASVTKAYQDLIHKADSLLGMEPVSVMDKGLVPPSGDKHDYMSQGPYWWPDPEKADGLPYVRRDGQTNPETRELKDAANMSHMKSAVMTLGRAYYFSGDERYSEKAAELIRTWYIDPETWMNPNLNYSQRIPGICDGRGIGVIDGRACVDVIEALHFMEGASSVTPDLQNSFKAWVREFRDWLINSANGMDEQTQPNNHGTFYDLQVATYSLYVGDIDFCREFLDNDVWWRFDQIAEDGCQPREMARTKSFSYSVSNLKGLLELAAIGDKVGLDIRGYRNVNGVKVNQALSFLYPYVRGESQWPGTEISNAFKASSVIELLSLASLDGNYPEYKQLVPYLPEFSRDSDDLSASIYRLLSPMLFK